jgi:60 kDa SS-A/Ro ribonucleoprotein
LNDAKSKKEIAKKLGDAEQVGKYNVFPYQIMTTLQNMEAEVPQVIRGALEDALDIATQKVPDLGDSVAVLVDVSGSMSSPITGNRGTVTTKTCCRDVAALIASVVLKKNPEAWIVAFDTSARRITNLNPRDSVLTNTQKINTPGGGTDVSCGLNYIRKSGCKAKTVIIVSDNESWFNGVSGYYGYGRATNAASEWKKYSTVDAKGAKLICIDITPNKTTQVPDDKSVLNIGGFSDSVFDVISAFVKGDKDHFVDVVKKTEL